MTGRVAAAVLLGLAAPLGAAAGEAGCEAVVDPRALEDALDAAEARYAAVDGQGFATALTALSLSLPCLAEAIAPASAARFHTLVGLRLYGTGRISDARASFSAARTADPDRLLPAALVPVGHELHEHYAAAPVGGALRPIPPPDAVTLLFDGAPSEQRPADRPAIVQIIGAAGAPSHTGYLLPDDPLPAYPVRPDPPPDVPVERNGRWGWLVASGAGGVGAGVLYGLAASSAAAFWTADPEADDLAWRRGVQRRTNGLILAAAASGAASVGGIVGFAAAGDRR